MGANRHYRFGSSGHPLGSQKPGLLVLDGVVISVSASGTASPIPTTLQRGTASPSLPRRTGEALVGASLNRT